MPGLKKEAVLGGLLLYISPTLRIDQIFFNDHFTARQVNRIFGEGVSDHHALVADLVLKKN